MSTVLDTRTEGPASELDPFSDDFLTDPFPALDVLRDVGPAVHLTRYGIWAVAGYWDAHAVLRDPKRFSSASGVGLANLLTDEYGWRKPSLILEVDPQGGREAAAHLPD